MLTRKIFSALLIVSALAFSIEAEADHRHWRRHSSGRIHVHPSFSFYWGSGGYYPRRYYYPYYPHYYPYYPPSIITVPSSPPVYIERSSPPSSQPLATGYWYYCHNPKGYYPYVKECPAGWQQVSPTPTK